MKRFLALAWLLAACSPQEAAHTTPDSAVIGTGAPATPASSLPAAAATITPDDVYRNVAYLASDELKGRDTPSEGLEAAARWIADAWADAGLEPGTDHGWFQRYPLPAAPLDADTGTRGADPRPPNVVGVLPGSDPALRGTYVVLSAHFDHVGVGRPDASGDSIYNGADDDASGTSLLIEVAAALAALPSPPARSVLFLAVSGEEKGLLGSRWFSDNPTVPLKDIVANINMDMVGRNAPDSVVVIGQEYSSLGATVHAVARRHPQLGLTVAEDPWPEQRFFFRSDHFNFARKEIPALFFFTGTHEDYHRPGDEVDALDTDKVARIGRLVFYLVHTLATDPEAPRWDPEGLEAIRAMTR